MFAAPVSASHFHERVRNMLIAWTRALPASQREDARRPRGGRRGPLREGSAHIWQWLPNQWRRAGASPGCWPATGTGWRLRRWAALLPGPAQMGDMSARDGMADARRRRANEAGRRHYYLSSAVRRGRRRACTEWVAWEGALTKKQTGMCNRRRSCTLHCQELKI